jgi:hypothetical protein
MIYIGIDPGESGGIAVVDELGFPVGLPVKLAMLTSAEKLETLMAIWKGHGMHGKCILERSQPSPQMGTVSAFTYGRGYGELYMALLANGIPFDTVAPAKWQLAMQCRSGGDKNITKRRAQELFPNVKITHAIADALLISEYCRRVERGSISQPQGEMNGETQGSEEGPGRRTAARSGRGEEGGARKPFAGWVPKGRTRRHGPAVKEGRGGRAAKGSDSQAVRSR